MKTLYQKRNNEFVAVRQIKDEDVAGVQDYLITKSFQAWAIHNDTNLVPVFAWDKDGNTSFSAKFGGTKVNG